MSRRSTRLSRGAAPTYTEVDEDFDFDQDFDLELSQHKEPEKKPRSLNPHSPSIFECEDVMIKVCIFLCRSDLLNMVLVNKVSYHAAIPSLYRRFDCGPPTCTWPTCPFQRRLETVNADYVRRFCTTLEYFPHFHNQHAAEVLDVPRLETIIVNYNFGTGWCHVHHYIFESGYRCPNCPSRPYYRCPNCPARPEAERLVVRPYYTPFNLRKHVKKEILIPMTTCNNIVVQINRLPLHYQYHYNPLCYPPFLLPPTKPRKQLTLLIFPIFWDYGHIVAQQPTWRSESSSKSFSSVVWNLVHRFIGTHDILLVGLEDANPFSTQKYWDERYTRDSDVKVTGVDPSWRHGGHLKFKTFIDYLEDGDWGEELNVNLVNRWVREYRGREEKERKSAKGKKGKKRRWSELAPASDDEHVP